MAKNPDKIEKMMEEQGCTGKRVTKELIEARVEEVDYQVVVIAGQKMMFCGIKMKGGFVQVGKPAVCIDPSNWRDEIGKQISYDNAFEELWKLEAYHMTYVAPTPVLKDSLRYEGFKQLDDAGTVKHICRICDYKGRIETYVDPATTYVTVKASLASFTSNQEQLSADDFLVIIGDNYNDCYVCPSDVMAKKLS